MPSEAFLQRMTLAFNGFSPILKDAVLAYARDYDDDGDTALEASELFERYAAHCALQAVGLDDFDVAKALVGGENDTQIDAIAITVNGELMDSTDAIDEHAAAAAEGGAFDVGLVFVQATMSFKFPADKIALYMLGIQNFFMARPRIPKNEEVAHAIHLKDHAIAVLTRLGLGSKVACDVFAVWPGAWVSESNIEHATGIAETGLQNLEQAHIRLATRFHRWDGVALSKLAHADHVANDGEIAVLGLLPLPAIPGVSFGAVGYATAQELLTAVTDGDIADPNARLRETAFYGNVRAFLGLGKDAHVNLRIAETLTAEKGARRAEFVLRNNGVTILAKQATPVGSPGGQRLKLVDFHIVNGSQTTHTLFAHRERLDPSVLVPLKIVATDDASIAQEVVLGLNRQTPIDEIQILARNEFVGRVKRYLDLMRPGKTFWLEGRPAPLIMFERRTGEYRGVTSVDVQLRVVSLEELMQAYASAFLEAPHRVQREGRTGLLKSVPHDMFNDGHDIAYYFLSAMLMWRARQHFRSRLAWNEYPGRHQLLFALRTLAEPFICPQGRRDGEAFEYLRAMRQLVLDDKGWPERVDKACEVVLESARAVDRERRKKSGAPERLLPTVTSDIAGFTNMTKAVRANATAARGG